MPSKNPLKQAVVIAYEGIYRKDKMVARRIFKRWGILLAAGAVFAGGHWYLQAARPAFRSEVRSYLAPASPQNDPHDTIRQIAAVLTRPHHHRAAAPTVRRHEVASVLPARVEAARFVAGPQKQRTLEGTFLPFKRSSVTVAEVTVVQTTPAQQAPQDESPAQTADQFVRAYVAQMNPGDNIDTTRVISQQGNTTTLEVALVDGDAHLTERLVVANDDGNYEVVREERTDTNQSVSQACYNGRAWEECHGGV